MGIDSSALNIDQTSPIIIIIIIIIITGPTALFGH
jgi:hypothetical protein